MRLPPQCPRCGLEVAPRNDDWVCHSHGAVPPLWRPEQASYEDLADQLRSSPELATYLPWPLPLGWAVTDFGVVGNTPADARATLACCSGASEFDGHVDLVIVTEEPGTGLGARCAGLADWDPAQVVADTAPSARIKVEGVGVALWTVSTWTGSTETESTSGADDVLDRAVFVGEAAGRWLWLVFRPASAMLLLNSEWLLQDVSDLGPALLEVEFGGPPPRW